MSICHTRVALCGLQGPGPMWAPGERMNLICFRLDVVKGDLIRLCLSCLFLAFWLPAGCHGNLTVLNLLSASVAKYQHFRTCRKNYALDRKMIGPFRIVSTSSIIMQSLGRSNYARAVGCRSENWCFLYVTLGLPACGGHSSNKYCVTVYGSFLMPFLAIFFRRDCSVRCITWFSFTSPGGASIFAKLP